MIELDEYAGRGTIVFVDVSGGIIVGIRRKEEIATTENAYVSPTAPNTDVVAIGEGRRKCLCSRKTTQS